MLNTHLQAPFDFFTSSVELFSSFQAESFQKKVGTRKKEKNG